MLTIKQNFLETAQGGKPDRFVNQYEFMAMTMNPIVANIGFPAKGEIGHKNAWGIIYNWREDQPGGFPDHSPDKVVIQDIEHWQDYVHMPKTDYSDAEWEPFIAQAESIDRDEYFVTNMQFPGIFEMCHHLGEIKNTLCNLYEYPDEMHDLIKYITEFELKIAEATCERIHPDGLFHHDDWGTQLSTFMSPAMFDEFYLEPYKEVYGYWHEHGVDVVVHHSDSYAATLVPEMIEMGINVFQGAMSENNVPDLIAKYGGKITIMGDINSALFDFEGWTPEIIAPLVKTACDRCGHLYFIPCQTMGGPESLFPGAYDCLSDEINKYSKVYWDEHNLEPKAFA